MSEVEGESNPEAVEDSSGNGSKSLPKDMTPPVLGVAKYGLVGEVWIMQFAGVLVFVSASLCALIFLLISTAAFGQIDEWVKMRSVELFAMIAAIGIIVAIITKNTNPFVLTFGILLIGALIVPTKDMVSLALMASGTTPAEQAKSNDLSDGSEYRARTSDLASKIVSKLLVTPSYEGANVEDSPLIENTFSSKQRALAIFAVEQTLFRDRVATHLERSRFDGTLELLLSFGKYNGLETGFEGGRGYQEYYYRNSSNDEFLTDLRALRRQELVRFSYAELDQARITYLGKRVVCEYLNVMEKEEGCAPYPEIAEEGASTSASLSEPNVIDPRGEAKILCEAHVAAGGLRNFGFESGTNTTMVTTPHAQQLKVVSGGSGGASLSALLKADDGGDPYLTLWRIDGSSACNFVASDDDSGGNLDAHLGLYISGGHYVLVSNELENGTSQMNLEVKIASNSSSPTTPEIIGTEPE